MWFSNNTCTTFLYTGQTYTAPAQTEPTSITYYYKAWDNANNQSTCANGTATRQNVAPTMSTLTNNGPVNEGSSLTYTAAGSDTGG